MATTPTTEPTTVNAGDTVIWRRTLADYPASDGWALEYTLLSAAAKITINAVADGADHLVNAAAGTTGSWAAGDYAWRAQVSKAGQVFTVGEGRMTVRPSFTAATTLDTRSSARKALEAVKAYLADANNIKASEYEIAGRQLRRYTLSELWAHHDRLVTEVRNEGAADRIAAGLPSNTRVYVRFGQ